MHLADVEFGRVIGVTGGMGCGKTTFSELLFLGLLRRGHDATIVSTDNLRYNVLCGLDSIHHYEVRSALSERLKVELNGDRAFDFMEISSAIFADDASYAAYREIICPAVAEDALEAIEQSKGIAMLESALLFEDGLLPLLDGPAVLVTCDKAIQRERVNFRERDSLTREMIEARVSRQPSVVERMAAADALGVRMVRLDSSDELEFRRNIAAVSDGIAGRLAAGTSASTVRLR